MEASYSQVRLLEIGDLVLTEMGASKSGALTVGSFIQQVLGEADDSLYSKDVKALLEREGLIEVYKYVAGRSVITSHGMEVYRSGGLQRLFEERRKEAEVEWSLKTSTIETNVHSSKWNAWAFRTRWWPLIISGISLVISVAALWLSWRALAQ